MRAGSLGLGVGRTRGRIRAATALFVGDANTTVSVVSGWTRGTLAQNINPRLIRQITGLTSGTLYRFTASVRQNAANVIYARVSTDAGLGTGDLGEQTSGDAAFAADLTFTAPANGIVYVGAVDLTSVLGDYVEIQNSSVSVVPA